MNDIPAPEPEPASPSPSLLSRDHLVMQQVTGLMSNDFDTLDPQENPAGRVLTSGSLMGRMMMGHRSLTVAEPDGTPLVNLTDTVNLLRETMELTRPDGTALAHLRQRWSFFRTRVDMHLADGRTVELTGNPWDYDYQFVVEGAEVARVTRSWGGLGRALLGHSRYNLVFAPGVPQEVHAAVLGGVVALDLIRAKRRTAIGS
ncbi:LURP-one-related/scramblase family protein [Corynebacterium mastitidis]